MKNALFVIVLMLATACNSLDGPRRGPGSPGYIEKGESLYDGKRFVKLVPGSLFDADNTPGVFRLGLIWDERYGDNLHLIAAFPLGKVTSTSELRKSTEILTVKIDGKKVSLPRVKDSIQIIEDNTISKEHEANIKYKISRQTVKLLLSSKHVVLTLNTPGKVFEGRLHVPAKARNYYEDVYYTALSGLKRFYKEVWGEREK